MSPVAARAYGPVMPLFHPWRVLRGLPDVTLRWERMPGRLGHWCQRSRTITLHPDQSQAERRSTLSHELRHLAAGHAEECSAATELEVCVQAARDLIALDALADALVWSQDEWEVADELWVDVETARARIDNLTESEKSYIERRMAANEGAA